MDLTNVLYEKGFATRKDEGRAFRYTASMTAQELRTNALAFALDGVFGGSIEDLKTTLAELEKRRNRKK